VYIPDGTATTSGYLEANLNLPNGATITRFDAFVVDQDGTYNISLVQLWRADAAAGTMYGTSQIMAQVGPTSGSNTNIQDLPTTSISTPVVDNSVYVYYLRFGTMQANANLRLLKVVITYTVTKTD